MVKGRAENENEIYIFSKQNVIDAICRERNVQGKGCCSSLLICSAPNGLNTKALEQEKQNVIEFNFFLTVEVFMLVIKSKK